MTAHADHLIRVYGDSLSMPRSFIGVPFRKTYAEQVSQACEEIWAARVYLYNRARFDATIAMVAEDYRRDSINFGNPGGRILIVQCGVCDCAPRPIPPRLRAAINHVPGPLRSKIVDGLHRNRAQIQRFRLWRNTSPDEFTAKYHQLLTQASAEFERVYAINIAPTNAAIEAHSPGFSASIVMYNALIEQAVTSVQRPNIELVDVYHAILDRPESINHYIVEADGHHITASGHDLYARLIIEKERAFARSRAQ
jgi:hypothetical protein